MGMGMTKRVQDIISRKEVLDHPDFYVDTEEDDVGGLISEAAAEVSQLRSLISEYRRLEAKLEDAFRIQEQATVALGKAEESVSDADYALNSVFDESAAVDADDAADRIQYLERFISEASRYA